MAKVPREIFSGPKVRPLLFRKYLREANAAGVKQTTRRIITADNSEVQPGTFEGLRLETGRARPYQPRPELRAQCVFESGRVRVVSVFPTVKPGDLFWSKAGRFGARNASTQTLRVMRVRLGRVQDMTEADAVLEGVAFLPKRFAARGHDPRVMFGMLWNDINGDHSWAENPWVWIYDYHAFDMNIDAYLAEYGTK